MTLTPSQRAANESDGHRFVVAGAGAGKTRALVERCLARVLAPEPAVSLDEMLVVTFTDAAAAELKERIRQRLSEELATVGESALSVRLHEQLALVDTAHIGTLHSFCLRLIREHFHELAIDPQLNVLADDQAKFLMKETLDELLEKHYAGRGAAAAAVQELLQIQAHGREALIRELILKTHEYAHTLPNPRAWLQQRRAEFQALEPTHWRAWLAKAFEDWRRSWLVELRGEPAENRTAKNLAEQLNRLGANPSHAAMADALAKILKEKEVKAERGQGRYRTALRHFFGDAAFLHSLAATKNRADPLLEDWNWVRQHMVTLLCLVEEFGQALGAAKRDMASVDFHDLEQFAIQLLWDDSSEGPTQIAEQRRAKFQLVFVDEYQDINAAQDQILRAVSRDGQAANRFLVGDVKQSIYRFRLSNPRIFLAYREGWQSSAEASSRVLNLSENFRSREMLVRFINGAFAELMTAELSGVEYDQEQALKFGAPEDRAPLTAQRDPSPSVEVHLRLARSRAGDDTNDEEENGSVHDDIAELTQTEAEARIVAQRLRALIDERSPVWDDDLKSLRPAKWSDTAILLRSVGAKGEVYAREFHRAGVPLQVIHNDFYANTEVSDLLSMLEVLDNPLQDIPLLAVLRSPFVGLSLNALAEIRVAHRRGHFWTALLRWREVQSLNRGDGSNENSSARAEIVEGTPAHPSLASADRQNDGSFARVTLFLDRFQRWRSWVRATPLSQHLEAILEETGYCDWLRTRPRGAQKAANVDRLVASARKFDPLQRQGLQRFLRYVAERREVGESREPSAATASNAVRLTTIHHSKGLEYPIVVVADLGKRFNLEDFRKPFLLDEEFGLCPQIKPPSSGRFYPSLPLWLAKRRQLRETLGEELRLLYVAMTRARDTLLLFGTVAVKTATEKWPAHAQHAPSLQQRLTARCYLDWLGPWWTRQARDADWTARATGQVELFRWTMHDEPGGTRSAGSLSAGPNLGADEAGPSRLTGTPADPPDANVLASLKERLEWRYPFPATTAEPAKTSISALRRRFAAEIDEEATPRMAVIQPRIDINWLIRNRDAQELSGADIGTAHHVFLQNLALEKTESLLQLKNEASRIQHAGLLSAAEAGALDLEAVWNFYRSAVGQKFLGQTSFVHRELPFTIRFSPVELSAFLREPDCPAEARRDILDQFENEYVVTQGVVDLAVILPKEIWILDFKTDDVTRGGLEEKTLKYEPQLTLYALALSRIYRRPVTECWLYFLRVQKPIRIAPKL